MKLILENWQKFLNEEMIDEELIAEVSILRNKYPFKALYILGPAGAGKSFLSGQLGIPIGGKTGFQISNPDERIETVFPTFDISLKFADMDEDPDLTQLQQGSRNILKNANIGHVANLAMIANPLLFDTTGENTKKISDRIEGLVKLGYDVGIIMINVPTEASVSRDATRERTVGAKRVKAISQRYQKEVVGGKAYFDLVKSLPNAKILGDTIFPNIYDFRNGKLLQVPTPITPEMIKGTSMDISFEDAKQKFSQIREDVLAFISSETENPVGKEILEAMKVLVRASKGKLGQNINDIFVALADPELAELDEVASAARKLISPAKVSSVVKKVTGKKVGKEELPFPEIGAATGKRIGSGNE